MVVATIGPIQTRLILDTGSDVHLITRELAEATGHALTTVDTGTDHSGEAMDSWVLGDVTVRFHEASGETTLTLRDVVAIPAPEAFMKQGIGGILSPQRLHGSAFAVIDEVGDELCLVDADVRSIRTWLLERHPTPDVLVIDRRPADDRPIVEAAIEPHPPVPTLINTGGRHTEFEPGAAPGLAGADLERIGTGVSGAPVMGAHGGTQVVALGGLRIEVASLMLRSGMDDPPAMIGQDLLRGTVVAVGPDPSTPVLWQVAALDASVDDGESRPAGSV